KERRQREAARIRRCCQRQHLNRSRSRRRGNRATEGRCFARRIQPQRLMSLLVRLLTILGALNNLTAVVTFLQNFPHSVLCPMVSDKDHINRARASQAPIL